MAVAAKYGVCYGALVYRELHKRIAGSVPPGLDRLGFAGTSANTCIAKCHGVTRRTPARASAPFILLLAAT